MSGYNSSIFAYGQTGSGKTHTMMGQIDKAKPAIEVGGTRTHSLVNAHKYKMCL
jgi:DNA replication protein DnaC